MWPSLLVLAGSLLTGSPVAIPVGMSQACFVFGEVFWSVNQATALLSSNCPIQIKRRERLIVMKGPHSTVNVLIPNDPGLHEFVYRWGQSVARFDDEKVEVALGPQPQLKQSTVEQKTGNEY